MVAARCIAGVLLLAAVALLTSACGSSRYQVTVTDEPARRSQPAAAPRQHPPDQLNKAVTAFRDRARRAARKPRPARPDAESRSVGTSGSADAVIPPEQESAATAPPTGQSPPHPADAKGGPPVQPPHARPPVPGRLTLFVIALGALAVVVTAVLLVRRDRLGA